MNTTRWIRISIVLLTIVLGASEISFAQTKRTRRKKPVLKSTGVVKKTTPVATAPAAPKIRLYTVDAGQTIHVRMNTSISSKTAKVGDKFMTTVVDPVYSTKGSIVIPAGAFLIGNVETVKPAAKGGKPGEIDVKFVQVKLPNQKTYEINGDLTELDTKGAKSDNEGTAKGGTMAHRKIIFIGGGGAGGAILGGAIGGGLGAAIGAGVGAVGGIIAETQTKGSEATVKTGTEFGVYLNQPVSLPKFVEEADDPQP